MPQPAHRWCVRRCYSGEFIHFVGLILASAAGLLGAQGLHGRKARRRIEPSGEGFSLLRQVAERTGFAGEIGKDSLSDVPGQMRIAIEDRQSGRMDEIDVALNQASKSGF